MNQSVEDAALTPEQWKEVYEELVGAEIQTDAALAAQYAASIFTVEAVYEYTDCTPEHLRELTGQGRKDAFKITIEDLITRARREGYKVAGSIDCVQWIAHATLLVQLATTAGADSVVVVRWYYVAPDGPMTFWIRSVDSARWLKFHLRVVLKPKSH